MGMTAVRELVRGLEGSEVTLVVRDAREQDRRNMMTRRSVVVLRTRNGVDDIQIATLSDVEEALKPDPLARELLRRQHAARSSPAVHRQLLHLFSLLDSSRREGAERRKSSGGHIERHDAGVQTEAPVVRVEELQAETSRRRGGSRQRRERNNDFAPAMLLLAESYERMASSLLRRNILQQKLAHDLSTALGVSQERVRVVGLYQQAARLRKEADAVAVSDAMIVVDVLVLEEEEKEKGRPDVKDARQLVQQLAMQAKEQESAMRLLPTLGRLREAEPTRLEDIFERLKTMQDQLLQENENLRRENQFLISRIEEGETSRENQKSEGATRMQVLLQEQAEAALQLNRQVTQLHSLQRALLESSSDCERLKLLLEQSDTSIAQLRKALEEAERRERVLEAQQSSLRMQLDEQAKELESQGQKAKEKESLLELHEKVKDIVTDMFYSSSPKSQHTPTSLLHMLQQVRARTERSHKEQEEQLRHLQQQLSHLELENDRLLSASRTAQNDTREDLRASLQELTRARGELEKMRRGEAALKQLVEETVAESEERQERIQELEEEKSRLLHKVAVLEVSKSLQDVG